MEQHVAERLQIMNNVLRSTNASLERQRDVLALRCECYREVLENIFEDADPDADNPIQALMDISTLAGQALAPPAQEKSDVTPEERYRHLDPSLGQL